ncbi:MAG: substrate-binding domain-containing protein, partial [Clostridiaceae bacterium]|nr:substrate-binding domain-containing protein [Clostridiaceae bacterium]
MKKFLSIVLCIIFVLSMLSACGQPQAPVASSAAPAAPAKPSDSPAANAPAASGNKEIPQGLKIGYGVSTLNNGFHQAHATWAEKYAKEKYGADVQIFDGNSDANVMAQNFDQAVAQGLDMVSLHIWEGESIKAAAQEAADNGMVISTYFDKIPGFPNPHVMPGEAEISEEMGKIAAEQ